MELKEYARVLWKKGWIIVLVAFLTAASAVVFAKTQQVIYRSSAHLQVIPARGDYGLGLYAQQFLRQYSRQIQTSAIAQPVIDRLQLDTTPEKLLERVTVAAIPEDYIIRIDVDLPDPQRAMDVANNLASEYIQFHAARMMELDRQDRVEVLLLEPAKWGAVYWPKTKTLALAGGLLGLLLGGLLALGLEYLESGVIRTPEEIERYMGLSVLGSIPTIRSASRSNPKGSRPKRST